MFSQPSLTSAAANFKNDISGFVWPEGASSPRDLRLGSAFFYFLKTEADIDAHNHRQKISLSEIIYNNIIPILTVSSMLGIEFRSALRAVAEKHNLEFIPGRFFSSPHAFGNIGKKHVRITKVRFGHGRHMEEYVRVAAEFPFALNSDLEVTREGFLNRLVKYLGRRELEFEDREFDSEYFVRSNNPREAKKLLNTQARHGLLSLSGADACLLVKNSACQREIGALWWASKRRHYTNPEKSEVICDIKGEVKDSHLLEDALELVLDVADNVEFAQNTHREGN